MEIRYLTMPEMKIFKLRKPGELFQTKMHGDTVWLVTQSRHATVNVHTGSWIEFDDDTETWTFNGTLVQEK